MSGSGITPYNSGPLVLRTYADGSPNNTHLLGRYEKAISSNYIVMTSSNGLIVPTNNVYVSSMSVSSLFANKGSISTLTVSTLGAANATVSSLTASTSQLVVVTFSSLSGSTLVTDSALVNSTCLISSLGVTNLQTTTLNGNSIGSDTITINTKLNVNEMAVSTIFLAAGGVGNRGLIQGGTGSRIEVGTGSFGTVNASGELNAATTSLSTLLVATSIKGSSGAFLNMDIATTSTLNVSTLSASAGNFSTIRVSTTTVSSLGVSTLSASAGNFSTLLCSTLATSTLGVSTLGVTVPASVSSIGLIMSSSAPATWNMAIIGATTTPAFGIFNTSNAGVQLTWGATAWTTFSDARLKTQIAPLGSALGLLNRLEPVTYRYLSDSAMDIDRVGFLAQDVQRVFPDTWMVRESSHIATDAAGQMFAPLTLSMTEMIPHLVKGLQELTHMVQSQAAEIQALRQRMDCTVPSCSNSP